MPAACILEHGFAGAFRSKLPRYGELLSRGPAGPLSWVPFLEPLSEHERGWLAGRLSCTGLEAGKVSVLNPEEHAERMVLLLVGQLQVYETDSSGGS